MDQVESQIPRVPARIILASIAAMWVTYLVLATLRGWLVGLELLDALFWRRLIVTFASMGVTVALWPVLRLLDPRPVWQKSVAVLAIALPASLLLAAINQWVFAGIENKVVSKIAEREGLRVSRDESGNLLVDPIPTPQPPPAPVPVPAPRATDTKPSTAPAAPPALPAAAAPAQPAASAEPTASPLTIDKATRDDNRWRQLTDVALGRYFLLLAWAALYYALVNAEQARTAERREGEYRRAAKAAELRSLRYQVNPHFLFNTLNSLSALVMTGKSAAAEQMIQTLSNFYRRSLAGDPTGDVALDQEIELQRYYLEIEAVRFPERLVVRIDLPAHLNEARVPGMILQPLVENSVKYAVAPVIRPVTVAITAREEAGRLVLEVSDDGPGKADSGLPGFGIGLANVRDRLAARYGDTAQLASGPLPSGGWRTTIHLPLERHA
ncbi:sensor histidine kinase [Novosphingobium sp.]|uniref:sensor histidine kinase n=1 Tax=Novosphingobium sp. TaxID=1874826 RepID=UPI0035AEC0D1